MIIKKVLAFLIFGGISLSTFAQTNTSEQKNRRPDIPGTFVLEVGVNRLPGAPKPVSIGLWGSRTVNIYYQYDIRIMKSRFAFVPGIGLSLERFKFVNSRTLAFDENDSLKMVAPSEIGLPGLRKSQLIMNYIDVPLEIKYSSKPEDPARTFKASAGVRFGYMYDAFTKWKYTDDGELFRVKNKRDWSMTRFRYGVYGKIGVGNFSFFGYYNATDLFKSRGINEKFGTTGRDVNFNTFTVGVSLSSF